MQHRQRYFFIAVRNAIPRIPRWASLVFPVLLAAWVSGLILLPGPRDTIVDGLGWAAVAVGVVSAMWFHLGADLRSRYPRVVLAGGAFCLALCGYCLGREFSTGLLVRLALPLLLVALHGFYIFCFSVYWGKNRHSRLQVGDRFPEFALPDSSGRVVTLADVLARGPALFTFYKGDW